MQRGKGWEGQKRMGAAMAGEWRESAQMARQQVCGQREGLRTKRESKVGHRTVRAW